jgi:transcriptional regulator with XRE-family HTH domain
MRGGDYVLMARRRAGLTQRDLAERLGVRQATIARWERGDRQIGIEGVEAVAGACGLHLEAHLVAERPIMVVTDRAAARTRSA